MGMNLKRVATLARTRVNKVLVATLAIVLAVTGFAPVLKAGATGAVNVTWHRPSSLDIEPEGRVDVAENPGTGKATITIGTLWIEIVDGLTINGTAYNTFPVGADELLQHYANQEITFDTEVDIAATYTLVINTHHITPDETFLGNFLWENDETSATAMPDDIIGHGAISFVKATYGGRTYNTVAEVNAAGPGFSWEDSIPFSPTTGSATFPVGTILTIKLIPEAGYQLTSFGINGGAFEPQANIGEYTFTIRGGNAHLAANFEAVSDVVDAQSGVISAGTIALGGNEVSMGIGTAKLEVADVSVSSAQISNFETAANGYKVSNYLNISLFNTVYKGSQNAAWDTEVTELGKEATITLQLAADVDGNDIIIVHEKHDGTYEVIPTVYDAATHTITFKTSSFSNYAIAARTVAGSPDSGIPTSEGESATSGVLLTVVAAAGLAIVNLLAARFAYRRKK